MYETNKIIEALRTAVVEYGIIRVSTQVRDIIVNALTGQQEQIASQQGTIRKLLASVEEKDERIALLKEQQQWIPFSEKKPDKDGMYIVALKEQYTGKMVVTMREYYKSSKLFYICTDEEITHWMSLPKQPKDGENE